ncbi:MAG TPA: hypothetical protein VKE40_20670 [Gemmataceae bacterium]|nr:hypothetical protein [Gemmataceae bacterium]
MTEPRNPHEHDPRLGDHDPRADFDDEFTPRRRGQLPHRGPALLALGIVCLVLTLINLACGPLGFIAWFMATSDLKKMREGRMDPDGRGLTRAGQFLEIATVVLFLFLIVVFTVFITLII